MTNAFLDKRRQGIVAFRGWVDAVWHEMFRSQDLGEINVVIGVLLCDRAADGADGGKASRGDVAVAISVCIGPRP